MAVGVPLCVYAWEGSRKIWRWIFIAMVPLLAHAIMMSYSRGGMLAIVLGIPLMVMRTKRKRQFALMAVALAWMVPIMAGQEIRQEFFSSKDYDMDASANSRFDSWKAGYRIANDNPIVGVGLRNSPLFSHQYGADLEGRVIHSQYIQILADCGYPGLVLYLILLTATWFALRRTRKAVASRDDPEALRIRSMVSGIECGLFIFCIAAVFLSVELFELPYLMMLMACQLSAIVVPEEVRQPVPVPGSYGAPRAPRAAYGRTAVSSSSPAGATPRST
jgi:probable O-glycosylation ligase (exosortase A-associated)